MNRFLGRLEPVWRVAIVYAGVLAVATVVIARFLSVDRGARPETTIVSEWLAGARVARRTVPGGDSEKLAKEPVPDARERVFEDVLDEGPLLSLSPFLFSLSFVPQGDGVKVDYEGRVAYATPDDILKMGAYEPPSAVGGLDLRLGLDADRVFAHLAKELSVSRDDLVRKGHFRRIAVRRRTPGKPAPRDDLSPATLRAAISAAGSYVARSVLPDGSYRYEVDVFTARELPGYSWPRHSGATWFLAQAAALTQDRDMRSAVRRAARRLARNATLQCGERSCIGEGDRPDLGSSALALIAYVELVETGILPELRPDVARLADFLRSQQRPDGEFMHVYDRKRSRPIDIQYQYYTGEAALALSRAHRVTQNPADLEAGRRALDFLVHKPVWFLASRYFWQAEHWTCQALEDQWDRAPNRDALQFCLEWQEFVRSSLIDRRDAVPEYEGACTRGPFLSPRLGFSASRMEAAVATLATAERAGVSPSGVRRLELGLRRTLKFLMRYQLLPGPTHLMPDPGLVFGGFPGGTTEMHVRIDDPQHAGAALLRYLRLLEKGPRKAL